MSLPPSRWAAAVAAGLLVAGLVSCTSNDPPPREPARPGAVALSAEVPEGLSIGVVVSLSAAPGEGAEWRDAAEGARVAAQRFASGGTNVTLVAANDKGTAPGAAAAVSTLVDRGVAGIVLATAGSHLSEALDKASERGVPVLLPYGDDADVLPRAAWLTGPDSQTTDARLVAALLHRRALNPVLVDAGGGTIAGLHPTATRSFSTDGDADALAAALARAQKRPEDRFDAVTVSGPAKLQATVVRALQGAAIDVPYALTSEALSPAFPATLRGADGSLSGDFVSAGLDTGDATALRPDAPGRALTAYFSALRMAAADPAVRDLLGERPFRAVAGTADVRSHDAVVALVRAAAAADSTDPVEVARALPDLRLDRGAGLAGPPLDFSATVAVADDAVVALGATSESPGLRPKPAAEAPTLSWFPVPVS